MPTAANAPGAEGWLRRSRRRIPAASISSRTRNSWKLRNQRDQIPRALGPDGSFIGIGTHEWGVRFVFRAAATDLIFESIKLRIRDRTMRSFGVQLGVAT